MLFNEKLQLIPEQRVCDIGEDVAIGVGLTVGEKLYAGPTHPAKVAITETVPPIVVEPVFVAVKEGKFPVPLAGKPIAGFELVQVNVAPPGVLKNVIPPTVAPLHTKGVTVGLTVGNGLTTTTVVPTKLGHPPTVTVKEYVPAAKVDAAIIVGFCSVDEKLFGPVQE